MTDRVLVDRNVPISMRDGGVLRADVYRPDTDAPVPAIISRLPYNKDVLLNQTFAIHAIRAAEGILRTRFRDGYSQPRPIEPGQVYEYKINLVATQ